MIKECIKLRVEVKFFKNGMEAEMQIMFKCLNLLFKSSLGLMDGTKDVEGSMDEGGICGKWSLYLGTRPIKHKARETKI